MRRPARRYYGTARNAPTRPVRGRSASRLLSRVALALAGAFALAWIADASWAVLSTTPALAVRRVSFAGAERADVEQLRLTAQLEGRNVLTLDLAAARERLLQHPWVRDAALTRRLPGSVDVQVVEREPVALVETDDGLAVLDERGQVIERDVQPGAFSLPLAREIDGDPERLRRAAATLAAVRAAAPRFHADLRRIDGGAADRLTLVSGQWPPVHVSGPESADELARYVERAVDISRACGPVESVDARFSDRLFLARSGG